VAPLFAAIASDVGNVRETNQDRAVFVRGRDQHGKGYALVVVADGIGGMLDGGVCAALAIGTFVAALDELARSGANSNHPDEWLRECAHAANTTVFSKYRGRGGSTLVAFLVYPETSFHWLSIGDSRVYCLHKRTLEQVSVDDTIAGQLGKNPEEASEQSRLLQFVGMGADLEPHIEKIDVELADAVMLTTDGVHFLSHSPGWLEQIVRNSPEAGVCVKRLIDLAKWCGGPDNATVAMFPLPVDLQIEFELDYPCLEIWDAYGELQLIHSMISAFPSENISSSNAPSQPKPAPDSQSMTGHAPDMKGKSTSKPIAEKIKSRRNKTPRKSKKITGEHFPPAGKEGESELSQLHMEFPTKSNEHESTKS
jgi:serine/threonine protein phosphatase PrpC